MSLQQSEMVVYDIPMEQIFCDSDFNCRGAIDPCDVVDLAISIREKGLQQPITVQTYDAHPPHKYRIVSGHRRFSAFRNNKAKTIPAIVKKGLTELDARHLNLEENLKRKDLNLLQEARALMPFMKAGWTQEMLSERFGQSRGWVQARVALLSLPEDVQNEAAAGFLTQEHIKQLKSFSKNPDQVREIVKKIKSQKIGSEKKKVTIQKKKKQPLKKRHRIPAEIFEMMGLMMDVLGPCFATRCMAWCAGEISEYELLRDFKEYAQQEYGIEWEMPREIVMAIAGAHA